MPRRNLFQEDDPSSPDPLGFSGRDPLPPVTPPRMTPASRKTQLTFDAASVRGKSPQKTVLIDPVPNPGASPWRIKVTVQAEPREDGGLEVTTGRAQSPSKRVRTTTVPLKDPDWTPASARKGRPRKSSTPATRRKPTPAKRKSVTPVSDTLDGQNVESSPRSAASNSPSPLKRKRGPSDSAVPAEDVPLDMSEQSDAEVDLELEVPEPNPRQPSRSGSNATEPLQDEQRQTVVPVSETTAPKSTPSKTKWANFTSLPPRDLLVAPRRSRSPPDALRATIDTAADERALSELGNKLNMPPGHTQADAAQSNLPRDTEDVYMDEPGTEESGAEEEVDLLNDEVIGEETMMKSMDMTIVSPSSLYSKVGLKSSVSQDPAKQPSPMANSGSSVPLGSQISPVQKQGHSPADHFESRTSPRRNIVTSILHSSPHVRFSSPLVTSEHESSPLRNSELAESASQPSPKSGLTPKSQSSSLPSSSAFRHSSPPVRQHLPTPDSDESSSIEDLEPQESYDQRLTLALNTLPKIAENARHLQDLGQTERLVTTEHASAFSRPTLPQNAAMVGNLEDRWQEQRNEVIDQAEAAPLDKRIVINDDEESEADSDGDVWQAVVSPAKSNFQRLFHGTRDQSQGNMHQTSLSAASRPGTMASLPEGENGLSSSRDPPPNPYVEDAHFEDESQSDSATVSSPYVNRDDISAILRQKVSNMMDTVDFSIGAHVRTPAHADSMKAERRNNAVPPSEPKVFRLEASLGNAVGESQPLAHSPKRSSPLKHRLDSDDAESDGNYPSSPIRHEDRPAKRQATGRQPQQPPAQKSPQRSLLQQSQERRARAAMRPSTPHAAHNAGERPGFFHRVWQNVSQADTELSTDRIKPWPPQRPSHPLLKNFKLLPRSHPWTENHFQALLSLYKHWQANANMYSASLPQNRHLLTPSWREYVDIEFANWGYDLKITESLILVAALFSQLLVLEDAADYDRLYGGLMQLGFIGKRTMGAGPISNWHIILRLFTTIVGDVVRSEEDQGRTIDRTPDLKWRYRGQWLWRRGWYGGIL